MHIAHKYVISDVFSQQLNQSTQSECFQVLHHIAIVSVPTLMTNKPFRSIDPRGSFGSQEKGNIAAQAK